jgi:peptide/nickel transport system substrate-binding protein
MIGKFLGHFLLACSLVTTTSAALAQQAPRDGGVLRVGIQSEPRSLDPLLVITDGATGHVVSNIFNTLVRYDAKMQIVPDLATSWRLEDDGRAVDFFLRKGVKFHDGTDFDAAAVKFAFDRILDPANSSPYRTFFKPVEQVVVINPGTVRVCCRSPGRVSSTSCCMWAAWASPRPPPSRHWATRVLHASRWVPARSSSPTGRRATASY